MLNNFLKFFSGKKNKKLMSVAGVVFYDKNLNIAVQERGDYAKTGEVYGFWGGRVEEDETPFQAIRRELKEELGFVPEKLTYWDKFTYLFTDPGVYEGCEVTQYVFYSPITEKLLKAKVKEGRQVKLIKLDKVIGGEGFPTNSTDFIKGFREELKMKK